MEELGQLDISQVASREVANVDRDESLIDAAFPFDRGDQGRRAAPMARVVDIDVIARVGATGTSAVCKPRLLSIIVIGSRSMIVTTLIDTRDVDDLLETAIQLRDDVLSWLRAGYPDLYPKEHP